MIRYRIGVWHTGEVTTLRTARERARAEIQGEILATARAHLALHGAAGLSLRAVARDLGLVPSAVYRYFENRDVLLTALIVDAYDALGTIAEATVAEVPRHRARERWVTAAARIRGWAITHPHEYALLYGSPVPGYAAPVDTVGPGTRVSLALVGVVVDAFADGLVTARSELGPAALSAETADDLGRLTASVPIALPAPLMLGAIVAWTQLFGLLSFEVFGQTRGLVDHDDALFVDAATLTAAQLGLLDAEAPPA